MEEQKQRADLNIKKLQYLIETGLPCLTAQQDYAVLLLGNTGSGKSTLINLMTGKNLKPFFDEDLGYSRIILDEQEQNGATIGNTSLSETTVPKHYFDNKNNIVYIDCPGFGDNKGAEQDISNAVFIQQLFQITKQIKIILVAPSQQFDFRQKRGTEVLQFIQQISEMFPQPEILKNSIALVVTKCQKKPNVINILNKLKEEHMKNKESQYFAYFENKNSSFNHIYNILLSEDKIAIFNEPADEDKSQILVCPNLIQKICSLEYVKLDKIVPPLSKDSIQKIYEFYSNLVEYAENLGLQLQKQTAKFLKNSTTQQIQLAFDLIQKLQFVKQNENFNIKSISQNLQNIDNNKKNDNIFNDYHKLIKELCDLVEFKTQTTLESEFSFLDKEQMLEKINKLSFQEKQEILNRNPFVFIVKAIAFVSQIQIPQSDLPIYTHSNFEKLTSLVNEKLNSIRNLLSQQMDQQLILFSTVAELQLEQCDIQQLEQLEQTKNILKLNQKQQSLIKWIDCIKQNFESENLNKIQPNLEQLLINISFTNCGNDQNSLYFQFQSYIINFSDRVEERLLKLQSKKQQQQHEEQKQQYEKMVFEEKEKYRLQQIEMEKMISEAKNEEERKLIEKQKQELEKINNENLKKAEKLQREAEERQKKELEEKKMRDQEETERLKEEKKFNVLKILDGLKERQKHYLKEHTIYLNKYQKTNDCLEIIGCTINLSKVLKKTGNDLSDSLFFKNNKPLILFATNQIIIDCNLTFHSGCVIFVAPLITCSSPSIINLSGKNGKDGQSNGKDGTWDRDTCASDGGRGDSGTSGMYGGSITMVAHRFEYFKQNLKIYVNGGNGGDGKNGGNGGSCNMSYWGTPNKKKGGNGGDGGNRGFLGYQGKISLFEGPDSTILDPSQNLKEVNEKKGEFGKPGKGGEGGSPWEGGAFCDSGEYGQWGKSGSFTDSIGYSNQRCMNSAQISQQYKKFLNLEEINKSKQLKNFNNLMQKDEIYQPVTGYDGYISNYKFLDSWKN